MPHFGLTSRERLETCHPWLQTIANELIKYLDVTVVCGRRGKEEQDRAFAEGRSKLPWPKSKHNVADENGNEIPNGLSRAIDLAPYVKGKGIVWKKKSAAVMAGMVLLIAAQKGIKVRWGGDWDMDQDFEDQTFEDLWHFELVEES